MAMTLHYADDHLTVHIGDCRDVLATLPAESVHCVVTSPPYWGLRDYGVSDQLGLEPTPEAYVADMVEVFREVRRVLRKDGTCWVNMGDGYANDTKWGGSTGGKHVESLHGATGIGRQKVSTGLKPKDLIGMPWRLAFALQADGWYLRSDIIWAKPNPMPESVTDRPTKSHEYLFLLAKGQWVTRVVQPADLDRQRIHLLDHLRSKGAPVGDAARLVSVLAEAVLECSEGQDDLGLPPLDAQVWQQRLDGSDTDPVGRLPIEHRAAGWASRFLTANCSAEEFLRELNGLWVALPDRQHLLERWCASELALTPSVDGDGEASVAIHDSGKIGKVSLGRTHGMSISRPTGCSYFYDADAVREQNVTQGDRREGSGRFAYDGKYDGQRDDGTQQAFVTINPAGRNLRSVWQIATEPYPGAHFATFPQKLVEPCIKAGTSERGVCPECGAPWVREVERTGYPVTDDAGRASDDQGRRKGLGDTGSDTARRKAMMGRTFHAFKAENPDRTLGWQPSCAHVFKPDDARTWPISRHDPIPATVLDPFAGSGTTGLVANHLGRRAILIDLSADYIDQAMLRNQQAPLGIVG